MRKKITRVEIENFQSHTHTVVDFEDGLNAIIGQSDQGKTAIIRAIKWALYNKPSGTSFIRKGTSKCSVTVYFNDGSMVKRYRSKTENGYDVRLADGTEYTELTGFGVGVPTEVLQAHGMRAVPLGFGRESLNISEQLDGPFLIKDSPQQRAMAIGRLAHTEKTDRAEKNTSKDIRNISQDMKRIQEEISKIEEDMTNYSYLDELKVFIDEVDLALKDLEQRVNEVKKIKEIVIKLKNETKRRENLEKIIDNTKVYIDICEAIESLITQFNIYSKGKGLLDKIKCDKERLNASERIIKLYSNIDEIIESLKELEEKIDNYNTIRNKLNIVARLETQAQQTKQVIEKYKGMDELIEEINDCYYNYTEYSKVKNVVEKRKIQLERREKGRKVIKQIKAELDEVIDQYKNAIKKAGKCPLCFSDVDEVTLDKISKSLF